MRPFFKIDNFNEISIEKCCRDRFVGVYENLSNWNNSYYLACDKEIELIGMPFEFLLEIAERTENWDMESQLTKKFKK